MGEGAIDFNVSSPSSVPSERLSLVSQCWLPQAEVLSAEVGKGRIDVSHGLSGDVLSEIHELRTMLGCEKDLRTDPLYLLGFYDEGRRRPVTVLLRSSGKLIAALVFTEILYMRRGSGIFLLGDIAGDGAVIGDPDKAQQHIRAAVEVLFRKHPLAHTVRVCICGGGTEWPETATRGMNVSVRRRTNSRRLKLARTFPEMLSTFGKSTRRKLCKKRAAIESEMNVRFIPSLPLQDAWIAMVELTSCSTLRRPSQAQNRRRQQLLQNEKHAFSMGLQRSGGEWISFVSGWRADGRTYVDMQMNNAHYLKESISAVMRSFLMEHEIMLGQTDIIFVGGTSILLQRYCENDESCVDLLFRRRGILSKAVERFARMLAPAEVVQYVYEIGSELQGKEEEESASPTLVDDPSSATSVM